MNRPIFFLLFLLWGWPLFGQAPTPIQKLVIPSPSGTQEVQSGAILTIDSGATIVASPGSTVTGFGGGGTVTSVAGASPLTGTVTSSGSLTLNYGSGLTISSGTLVPSYGSSSNTVAQGNDTRFPASVTGIRLGAGVGSSDTALAIGSGLNLTTGTLTASGSGGTVTSITTLAPLLGGPITSTGTISLNSTGTGTAVPLASIDSSGNLVITPTSSSGAISLAAPGGVNLVSFNLGSGPTAVFNYPGDSLSNGVGASAGGFPYNPYSVTFHSIVDYFATSVMGRNALFGGLNYNLNYGVSGITTSGWSSIYAPNLGSTTGTTSATTTVKVASLSGISIGMALASSNNDIVPGTTITGTSTGTLTLSVAATGSHAGETISFATPSTFTGNTNLAYAPVLSSHSVTGLTTYDFVELTTNDIPIGVVSATGTSTASSGTVTGLSLISAATYSGGTIAGTLGYNVWGSTGTWTEVSCGTITSANSGTWTLSNPSANTGTFTTWRACPQPTSIESAYTSLVNSLVAKGDNVIVCPPYPFVYSTGPNTEPYSAAWFCQGSFIVNWMHTNNFGAGVVVANTDTIQQMQLGTNYDVYRSTGAYPHPNDQGYGAIASFLGSEFQRLFPSAVAGYSNPLSRANFPDPWLSPNVPLLNAATNTFTGALNSLGGGSLGGFNAMITVYRSNGEPVNFPLYVQSQQAGTTDFIGETLGYNATLGTFPANYNGADVGWQGTGTLGNIANVAALGLHGSTNRFTVDGNGNGALPGNLAVTNTLTAGSGSFTNLGVGGLTVSSGTVTGTLTIGTLNVTGNSSVTGTFTAGTGSITNNFNIGGSLSVTGSMTSTAPIYVNGSILASGGQIYFPSNNGTLADPFNLFYPGGGAVLANDTLILRSYSTSFAAGLYQPAKIFYNTDLLALQFGGASAWETLADAPYSTISTPATGGTVTGSSTRGSELMEIEPAGTLSALTVDLESADTLLVGTEKQLAFSQIVSTVTVAASGAGGGSIDGSALTVAAVNTTASYKKIGSKTWRRLY